MAQQIQTLSSNPNSLSGWTISQELIESWANSSEIDAANEMRPCGCGIKIDLQDIVYPALRETAEMGLPGVTGFGIRVDACVSEGQLEARKRDRKSTRLNSSHT